MESPVGVTDTDRVRAMSKCADSLARVSRQLMTTSGQASPERIARFDAVQAYYQSLLEQVERARQGKAVIPEVPPRSELDFIDGWLVWKGRPVWWSGYRPDGASAPVSSTAAPAAGDAAHPSTRERPRLRRLLTLPWRRAAA
ncbi:hypothetical protein [Longimicrobium sp.]|uniref:hypothetical protein n=1 Tax=Longimicrobium sp. TaxID=2029185 RepID=UPI003B3A0052